MACFAHFYVKSDMHCTFYSSLYLFTFVLYQGRDFCSSFISVADSAWAHGFCRTIFVCNRQFAKVDKGSNLRWWQKLIWIISMSIATAILGAIRVKMEGWWYTKMTLGLRNFTQKTAECYFKGRKTISYFTWLIIGCYAAINAVQLLRLVFILKLFFNHISSFDYKLFQNYFYFRKFHNIRFIFVSIIFLIWFAKRH